MANMGSNGIPYNTCGENPALDTVPFDILLILRGQLLLRYTDPNFVSVYVPDFGVGDNHVLQVTFEDFGCNVKYGRAGRLTQDVRLKVEKEPSICFYLTGGTVDELQKKPNDHQNDIRYLADFQRSDFHADHLPLDIHKFENKIRTISIGAGSFYASRAPKFVATRTQGDLLNGDYHTVANYQVATEVSAKIQLNGGPAELVYDDGNNTPFFDSVPDISKITPIKLVITNLPPPSDTTTQSDFQTYYKIIQQIPLVEHFDFQYDPSKQNPFFKPGEFECPSILKNDDVPCMPGGGGLP